jgi:uncharacterized protein (TIGR02569 family)
VSSPPAHVLDLFAVTGEVHPLPGGRGGSVRAGDLVLSPGRDAAESSWLSPVLARLAVRMDERAGRRPRDLRVAVPVPARDGTWVVDGWAASRYEPGTTTCTDLDVVVAAGRVLHAELASAVPARPAELVGRTHRWASADALANGSPAATVVDVVRGRAHADLVTRLLQVRDRADARGVEQLVHGDLAGNVLLDAAGAAVVIDVAPYWRDPAWAEAVAVLDLVLWSGADRDALTPYAVGPARAVLARAALFRLLSDDPPDTDRYVAALTPLLDDPVAGTGAG